MRRKIPLFKVFVQEGASYNQLSQIPAIQEAVREEAILAIGDGIKNNKTSISLFNIDGSEYCIELDKSNWKPTLENVLKHYIEVEDYTKAIICRDLLIKL